MESKPYKNFPEIKTRSVTLRINRKLFSIPGGGGGALQGLLCGGVPLGSPNPDPISDQKM